MGISRSDMSCFISHVLDKRYEAAGSQLRAMLCTSDPERQLQARADARAMIEFVASYCFENVNEYPVEDKIFLLDFLYTSYALIGDKENELIMRYELLVLLEPMSSRILKEWLSFARDCYSQGYIGNSFKAYDKIITCPINFHSREGSIEEEATAKRYVVAEATHEKRSIRQLLGRECVYMVKPVRDLGSCMYPRNRSVRSANGSLVVTVQESAVAVHQKQMTETVNITDTGKDMITKFSTGTAKDRYVEGIKRRHSFDLQNSQKKAKR